MSSYLQRLAQVFAQEVGKCENLEQMRQRMQQSMQAYTDERGEMDLQDRLLRQAAATLDFTVDPETLEKAVTEQLQNMEAQLKQQGLTMEMYCRFMNTTEEKLREEGRANAIRSIRNQAAIELIVELEGADGCDMEQLTYRMAHKDGKTYSYTATLNHRVYQPGDTIEISFRDLVYQGKAVDIQEAIKSGLLKVSLSDYCMVGSPEENAFTWTEDGRAVLTVTQDMAPDTDDIPGYVYSVTVYVGEEAWFFSGIIIY